MMRGCVVVCGWVGPPVTMRGCVVVCCWVGPPVTMRGCVVVCGWVGPPVTMRGCVVVCGWVGPPVTMCGCMVVCGFRGIISGGPPLVLTSNVGASIAQLIKSPDLQSIDRRFEPYCRQGVFLVWAFSKPLTPNC